MSAAGPFQGARPPGGERRAAPIGGDHTSAGANGSSTSARNYWIGVVSKDHVDMGVAGGYTQVNHGKAGPLERMRAGDGVAFYSPRTSYPDGESVQAFTAIGRIRDGTVYQVTLDASLRPFRLAVDYLPAQPAPVRPLIEALSFIRSKEHWGAAFRFGVVRVPEADFALIAAAMGRSFAADFAAAASPSAAPEPST